jgi:hypothetical protein
MKQKKKNRLPRGWTEDRIRKVAKHYDTQSDSAAATEDDAAWEDSSQTVMEIPKDLVPAVRKLLASHH